MHLGIEEFHFHRQNECSIAQTSLAVSGSYMYHKSYIQQFDSVAIASWKRKLKGDSL